MIRAALLRAWLRWDGKPRDVARALELEHAAQRAWPYVADRFASATDMRATLAALRRLGLGHVEALARAFDR